MKKALAGVLLLALSACCIRFPEVPVDLGGVIELESDELISFHGVFTVDARDEMFMVHFLDPFFIPRGSVTVHRGEVETDMVFIDDELAEIFRFWPFVFGEGRRTGGISFRDLSIDYGEWQEVERHRWFPGRVTVTHREMRAVIEITYGTAGPG